MFDRFLVFLFFSDLDSLSECLTVFLVFLSGSCLIEIPLSYSDFYWFLVIGSYW